MICSSSYTHWGFILIIHDTESNIYLIGLQLEAIKHFLSEHEEELANCSYCFNLNTECDLTKIIYTEDDVQGIPCIDIPYLPLYT